jgi:hypothetical protein
MLREKIIMRFNSTIFVRSAIENANGIVHSSPRDLLPIAAAAVAALAVAFTAAPANAANGFKSISISGTDNCLDNATQDAAKLQMWKCSGAQEQNWAQGLNAETSAFTFINQHTGNCITGPEAANGLATMTLCDPAALNQRWTVFYANNPPGSKAGWFQVYRNVASGLCLTTPSSANGTVLRTTTCDSSDINDRWSTRW